MNHSTMLDVINLDFDYQDQPLLNKVTLSVSTGELLHLRGANGAGKTTLLKLIAGLYYPLQGEIQFLGQNIHKTRESYQQQLCYIGHKAGINPNLTLSENCFFDLQYSLAADHELRGKGITDLEKLASIFNLNDHLNFPCGLLSAGQRRQAGLLRLWMSPKKLWLLDEPLVALDNNAIKLLMAKIEAHRQRGGAVLLTSHQQLPLNRSEYEEFCL